jgi:uncharacterized protein YndB with AHSA1/START domain
MSDNDNHFEPTDITFSIRIAATPDVVFPYLSERALLAEWIGITAETQPEPGGVFALDADYEFVRGEFVVIDPPNRVVFTWGKDGSAVMPAGSTTVEIVLVADGPNTVVELTHSGLPASQLAQHQEGWPIVIGRLGTAVRADTDAGGGPGSDLNRSDGRAVTR